MRAKGRVIIRAQRLWGRGTGGEYAGSRPADDGFRPREEAFGTLPEVRGPVQRITLHRTDPPVDVAIVVRGAGESQLIDLMNDCIARYPTLKLFSLPSVSPERRIELGVKGEAKLASEALAFLQQGVSALGFAWAPRE